MLTKSNKLGISEIAGVRFFKYPLAIEKQPLTKGKSDTDLLVFECALLPIALIFKHKSRDLATGLGCLGTKYADVQLYLSTATKGKVSEELAQFPKHKKHSP